MNNTYRIRREGTTFKKAQCHTPARFLELVQDEMPTLGATLYDVEVKRGRTKLWDKVMVRARICPHVDHRIGA